VRAAAETYRDKIESMALARCADCGNQCSVTAFSCPKCGRQFEHEELETSKTLTSLSHFISDNKDLLTSASVLTALSVFWSNASVRPLGSFLSFVSLAATVPILFEVHRKFDGTKSTWVAVAFMNIFTLLVGYTAWYLLVDFRHEWQTQMWKVVNWSLFIPLWMLYRYIDKPKHIKRVGKVVAKKLHIENGARDFVGGIEQNRRNRSAESRNFEIFLLNAVAFVSLLWFTGFVAERVAPRVNARLDKVYQDYKSQTPTPSPSAVPVNSPTSSSK
jgi:hypothetical protein